MKKHQSRVAWLLALVAALALLVSACGSDNKTDSSKTTTTEGGSSTTAAGSGMSADTALLAKATAHVDGQGSSFQDTLQQQMSSDFAKAAKDAGGSATVTYTKTGSADGKKALADKTVDYAGSDSPIKDEEKASFGSRKILYFPTVGGPITVAYNVQGVDKLQLSAETIAKIFSAKITSWDDAAIKADNPGATLPSTKITVVHRSDGSGTTSNFTKFLTKAAPDAWTAGSGDTVNWPKSTQGAEKSTGVIAVVKQTNGAVGYADLADAAKENLNVASVKNAAGEYVAPTPESASKALELATVNADLTYDPIWVDGAGAYPITSPTWMLVDAATTGGTADTLKAYLDYILTTGQGQAKTLFYAPLPESLAKKAIAQIDQIGS